MNWEQEAKLSCEMKWTQEYHEFLEKLAALEHDQWAHWAAYMLNHLTEENVKRWRRQIETPYKELSEDEKEKDRVWARKVLGIMFEEREILE